MPAETTSNTRGRLNAEMLETKGQREFNYSPLDCIFILDISTLSGGLRGSQLEVRSSTVVSSLYLNKLFKIIFCSNVKRLYARTTAEGMNWG